MSSAAGAVARWIAPFLTVAAVACVGLVADPVHVGPAPTVRLAADEANPLAGAPFYVNPTSAAMRAAQSVDPPSPELTAIANTPQAYWIDPLSTPARRSRNTSGDAQAAGAMPVLALYGIPHRDCGSFAAGGFASGADYRGMDRRHRRRPWAPGRRRSSSNPMRSPWPTACRLTSARNAST